jgi:hypothetical protein
MEICPKTESVTEDSVMSEVSSSRVASQPEMYNGIDGSNDLRCHPNCQEDNVSWPSQMADNITGSYNSHNTKSSESLSSADVDMVSESGDTNSRRKGQGDGATDSEEPRKTSLNVCNFLIALEVMNLQWNSMTLKQPLEKISASREHITIVSLHQRLLILV